MQTINPSDTAWLQAQAQHRAVWNLDHPAYPSRWRSLDKPPQTVWVQGQGVAHWRDDRVWQRPALAIVGSRNPTPQGLIHAREMARSLSALGICIVSGLALGIDGAAHEGALQGPPHSGMSTVAFVGTGVDRVYPRRHQTLAHQVAERGVLVSEYPLGSPAMAHHFPQRNRLIAASVDGVLVIEAALGSGSLITAYMALDMGKEVFAVPGSIHSPLSKGCHALLRQGATLVEGLDDILQVMRPSAWSGQLQALGSDRTVPEASAPADQGVADPWGLKPHLQSPIDLDGLVLATGVSAHELMSVLLEWQMQSWVSELPVGRFIWLHRQLPGA